MVAWDEAGWETLGREAAVRLGLGEEAVVDHFGVAVRCLEGLGEVVEDEGVRVRMVGRVELLEGLGEETVVGRFVARWGEGLHHVALGVTGLDGVCEGLRGVRLVGDGVRVGFGGRRYRFVHPESAGGVLVELVEVGK